MTPGADNIETVTLGFNESNVADVIRIKEHMGCESKAHAIVFALKLTEMLLSEIRNGSEVLIRNKFGNIEKIKITPAK